MQTKQHKTMSTMVSSPIATPSRGRKMPFRKMRSRHHRRNQAPTSTLTKAAATSNNNNKHLRQVLQEISNSSQHQEQLRVGKFTRWAHGRSASELYRTIHLVDQVGRHLHHPQQVTAAHALAASQVLRMAETELFHRPILKMENELLPWASVLTVQDVMGVLWLIGMVSVNNNATAMEWNPKHPNLQTPAHEGVTKLVRLVHGLPVSYQRGGREIAFTRCPIMASETTTVQK